MTLRYLKGNNYVIQRHLQTAYNIRRWINIVIMKKIFNVNNNDLKMIL